MAFAGTMQKMTRLLRTPVVPCTRMPARARLHVCPAQASATLNGFKAMEEVGEELSVVRQAKNSSELASVDLHDEIVETINTQINIEYNISYVYHAIHCYFDRDGISLPGLAAHFLQESVAEREHAQKLIKYLNKRGGKVVLKVRFCVHETVSTTVLSFLIAR